MHAGRPDENIPVRPSVSNEIRNWQRTNPSRNRTGERFLSLSRPPLAQTHTKSHSPVAFGRSSRTRAEQKISPGQTHTGYRQPFPIHRTRSPNRQAAETSIFHNRPKPQESPCSRNEKRAAAGRPYPSGKRLLTEKSEEPRQKLRPAENRLPVRFPGSFRTLSARFDFFVSPHGFYGHGNAHEKIRFDDQSPFEIREKSRSDRKSPDEEDIPSEDTITPSEGKSSVSSGPQDIRVDEAPAERRPRLSTRSRKASGPAQDAPTKAAPLSQRRFPFGPLGHNVRRLCGSPDGLLVAPFAGGDTFGERPAAAEYVDRRFPARTKRGTRKDFGSPYRFLVGRTSVRDDGCDYFL